MALFYVEFPSQFSMLLHGRERPEHQHEHLQVGWIRLFVNLRNHIYHSISTPIHFSMPLLKLVHLFLAPIWVFVDNRNLSQFHLLFFPLILCFSKLLMWQNFMLVLYLQRESFCLSQEEKENLICMQNLMHFNVADWSWCIYTYHMRLSPIAWKKKKNYLAK